LCGSTGIWLGSTNLQDKGTTLKVDEKAYTGIYYVWVGSDRIGDYTMRVDSDEHETVDSIQAKIDALKQELAALEDQLKALQHKQ
jgi:polyhydroxyalkanoate synthesis regulator phasin